MVFCSLLSLIKYIEGWWASCNLFFPIKNIKSGQSVISKNFRIAVRLLMESGTYEEWLQKIRADLDIANVQLDRVPSFTYFYVRRNDGEIVGVINIRLFLNDFLKREGGHVGYSIRPSERRKGFATRMLKEMGLSIMKKSRLV